MYVCNIYSSSLDYQATRYQRTGISKIVVSVISNRTQQWQRNKDICGYQYYKLSIYQGYIYYDSAHSTTVTILKFRSDLHPYGRAVGCLSCVIQRQMTAIYRECSVIGTLKHSHILPVVISEAVRLIMLAARTCYKLMSWYGDRWLKLFSEPSKVQFYTVIYNSYHVTYIRIQLFMKEQ